MLRHAVPSVHLPESKNPHRCQYLALVHSAAVQHQPWPARLCWFQPSIQQKKAKSFLLLQRVLLTSAGQGSPKNMEVHFVFQRISNFMKKILNQSESCKSSGELFLYLFKNLENSRYHTSQWSCVIIKTLEREKGTVVSLTLLLTVSRNFTSWLSLYLVVITTHCLLPLPSRTPRNYWFTEAGFFLTLYILFNKHPHPQFPTIFKRVFHQYHNMLFASIGDSNSSRVQQLLSALAGRPDYLAKYHVSR